MRRQIRVSSLVAVVSFGLVVIFAGRVNADDARRGLITTAACPYTCQDAGLSLANCRENRRGNVCTVEDFTQAPGHRSLFRLPGAAVDKSRVMGETKPRAWRDANGTWLTVPVTADREIGSQSDSSLANSGRRGLITSSACPFDCKHAGVERHACREWQKDGQCFVEDLTQAPGHRSRVVVAR